MLINHRIDKLWYLHNDYINEQIKRYTQQMEFREKILSQKASSERIYAEWFHLYDIQKHAKLNNIFFVGISLFGKTIKKRDDGNKNAGSSYFCWGGRGRSPEGGLWRLSGLWWCSLLKWAVSNGSVLFLLKLLQFFKPFILK